MGVINVTHDSLAGALLKAPNEEIPIDGVLERIRNMVRAQPDVIIDIGGESTKPGTPQVSFWDPTDFKPKPLTHVGAPSIDVNEELRRVIPIIEAVRKEDSLKGVIISIDTTKARVAECAIDAGANIINDISAGTRDPQMISVLLHLLV